MLNSSFSYIVIELKKDGSCIFATSNGSELCRITNIPFTLLETLDEGKELPGFKVMIELKAFSSFISLITVNSIILDFQENCIELIYKKNKRNKYVLSYYDISKAFLVDEPFEELLKQEAVSLLVLSTDLLKKINDFILPCCATDSARAFLNGCYIDNDNIMATNSRILGKLEMGQDIKRFISQPFFLSQKFLQNLEEINETISIAVYDYSLICKTILCPGVHNINVEILGKVGNTSQFPPAYQIITKVVSYPYLITVNTPEFVSALRVLQPFVDSFMRSVLKVGVDNSCIYLTTESTAKNKQGEDSVDILTCTQQIEHPLSFCISLDDIKNTVLKFSSDTTSLYLSQESSTEPIGIEDSTNNILLVIATIQILNDSNKTEE